MHMLPPNTQEIIIRVAIALALGSLLGLERTFAGKRAGMRTYAMVALGSALFILISDTVFAVFDDPSAISPLTLGASIISGIGFIGAGLLIFHNDNKVTGLTTAAGLWVAAGVGMAAGFGFFTIALVGTLAALLIFTLFWFIERGFLKISHHNAYEESEKESEVKK